MKNSMKSSPVLLCLAIAIVPVGIAMAGEFGKNGHREPMPALQRGICIDRQLRSIPPEDNKIIHRDDIRLIKSMGFDFVKLIFNPAVIQAEGDLDASHIWYLDQVVQRTVDEKLPVVVCIHPEPGFKQTVLNNADAFSRFVSFMKALAGHMADRWGPDQLAFQLMTEPFASSTNKNDWNHWDRLQRRLWTAVRSAMPRHRLILSGDMVGSIDGLFNITPVDDENVLYSFTFYEPLLFTQQGIGKKSDAMFHLRNLPYPSSSNPSPELPKMLASAPSQLHADITARVAQFAADPWNRDKLATRIGKLAEWRNMHGGKPKLWCAEFGCSEAAPAEDRRRYLNDVRELFEQHGIGWSYWSYNETFTVMDANRKRYGPAGEQTPDAALLKVLMLGNVVSLAGNDWRIVADFEGKGVEKRFFDAAVTSPEWIPAQVPGNIQGDVEAARIIGPLWYGAVNPKLYDVARRDWWYRKDFTVPASFAGKRITLTFEGVDDRCKVWLNGKEIGANAGMFNRFSFDVSQNVLIGRTNRLAVWIARMPEELVQMLVGSDGPNNGPVYGLADRARHVLKNFKTPGSMGFDWSANLWTLGIWKDVRIEATRPAKIAWTRVESKLNKDFTHATIHAMLDIDSRSEGPFDAQFRISGHGVNVSTTVPAILKKGANRIAAELPLDRPALWWPNGQGEQPLYTLDATIQPADGGSASDRSSTRFGVRDLRWIETENANPSSGKDVLTFTGRELRWKPAKDVKPERTSRLQLVINGRAVRMIGSALILPYILPGRGTEYTLHLLRCAKAAGINTLRLNGGGGGPLLDDAWYALADEWGIMISYEYPVANTMIDSDAESLGNLDAACRDMIRRTRNHPSIVEYVGGSEMGLIGKDWNTLNDAPFMRRMREIAAEECDRLFRATCPELGTKHGPWDFLLCPPSAHTVESDKKPLSDNNTVFEQPNVTITGYQFYNGPESDTMRYGEFGTASPANLEVWHRVIPPQSQWPLDNVNDPVLIYHNAAKAVFTDVNWLFKPWIDEAFGKPDNLHDLVAAGQYYGAEGLRYAYDALRRKGRRIGGMMNHCYSEPWPNAAGSYMIDCDGRPLMNYDFFKQALTPISLSLKIDSALYLPETGIQAEWFLVSDAPRTTNDLRATWLARDREGNVFARGETTASIAPLEVKSLGAIAIRPPANRIEGPILLELQLEDAIGKLLAERVHIFGSAAVSAPFAGLLKNRVESQASSGPAANKVYPLRRTTLQATAAASRVEGDEEVLAIEVRNTGAMTALFCEPHPLLVYRTDLLMDNNHCFIPPGEARIITIRAPQKPEVGLSLAQTGWTISTWNADDVAVVPNDDVVLSVGRWDKMCREFVGYFDVKQIQDAAKTVCSGNRPDASRLPYRLATPGEVTFAFECRDSQVNRSARLRIHTADQSPLTATVVAVTVNGRTMEKALPKGLGVQQTDPAHLAFPATLEFDLLNSDLHSGKNTLIVRVNGDGWFSWDALEIAIVP